MISGRRDKYIRDNHSNQQSSRLSALISYLKRLEGVKLGKYEAAVKTRELEKLYKLDEIHHLLPSLQEVANNRRVVVLVDELDRGWDSSEDARAFVAGLFQARYLNPAAAQRFQVHPMFHGYLGTGSRGG